MIAINSKNLSFYNIKQSDNIFQNRAIVNAIDTCDVQIDICKKQFDTVQKNNFIGISVLFLTAFVLAEDKLLKHNVINSFIKKTTPFIITSTLISALGFGLYNKKRAEGMYKANILGQKNAEKKLENPKLFLEISDKNLEQIGNNPIFSYYNNKKYTKEYEILPDLDIGNQRNFIKKINKEAENFIPKEDVQNKISNTLMQIDTRTQDYTKKITAGMNLIYAAGSVACGAVLYLLSKIKTKNNLLTKLLPLIASIPLFIASNNSFNNSFRNIESIAREKAKEDFISNQVNDKNFMQTTFDYLKSKQEYEQKILKKKDLVSIKNSILAKNNANESEIQRAKDFQKMFFEATIAKSRMKQIQENSLKNSISKDLIFNSLVAPFCFLLMKSLNNQKNNVGKSILALFSILTGGYCINSELTLLLNKNTSCS